MSAPSIPDILEGIRERLLTITSFNVVAAPIPGQITPPAAIVGVPPIPNYRLAMRRGTFEISPTIVVVVADTVSDESQLALAAYANPTGSASVVAAIEADRTLGNRVDDCFVESFRPLGIEEVGAVGGWGGIFTLFVAAQGGT